MRLVIEREGGFTIVEDADAITEIDVRNDAVVLTIEVGGDKWTTKLPVSSHAEACRVSAAVAVRCGELVEPLSKGPDEVEARAELAAIIGGTAEVGEVKAEEPEVDGEDEVGEAMAVAMRPSATVRRVTAVSEWVRGEPPRNGMVYVAREGVNSLCVRWDGERWMTGGMPVTFGVGVVHLPTALTMEGMARPVSEWVDGEPPRDGRWYVVTYLAPVGDPRPSLARWGGAIWQVRDHWDGSEIAAHLPTPIPSR